MRARANRRAAIVRPVRNGVGGAGGTTSRCRLTSGPADHSSSHTRATAIVSPDMSERLFVTIGRTSVRVNTMAMCALAKMPDFRSLLLIPS